MRCLAVCQDELVIRMLDEILLPGFEVEFIVDSKPMARRVHDARIAVTVGDPRRADTYLKADLTPGTCVIIEDNARRSLKRVLDAVQKLKPLAERAGCTLAQLALAWCLRDTIVAAVIVGATSPDQVDDNVAAL